MDSFSVTYFGAFLALLQLGVILPCPFSGDVLIEE